jgi:FRG domain
VSGSYPFQEFGSIDELTSLIAKATEGWDTRWYRGTKTPSHTLLPKLFRDKSLQKREGYISVEFRRRARPHLPTIQTPFEWLCAMQHYGFPTRLLDWSESLAVALYFTIRPVDLNMVAPTIWVLNPFELHVFAGGQPGPEIIPIATNVNVISNADIAFSDDSENTEKTTSRYPLPVIPDFLFNRLATQNGAFTIHGKDDSALEETVPKDKQSMLLKFVARPDRVNAIYDCLDLIIPSSDAVFPDIEGIKDYIV